MMAKPVSQMPSHSQLAATKKKNRMGVLILAIIVFVPELSI